MEALLKGTFSSSQLTTTTPTLTTNTLFTSSHLLTSALQLLSLQHNKILTITKPPFKMFSFKTLSAALLLAASVSAAPTKTTRDYADQTVELTGVTHSVVAGLGGLRFDPDNVVAEVGDVMEWHFLPANHSVAQADFNSPCSPSSDGLGFFAGFNFVTAEGQADNVFQAVILDDSKPIWYYCPQTKGNHCQSGMVGVINQNFNDQTHSLAKFRELAATTGTSVVPPVVQGGSVILNPNPNGGF
ncbi:hypothetical protein B0T10DRAFT_491130 [Thelonectria olida]|uniref:Extracellular serine-rich protein n=1 Tax=Thelonectria olida TaxID=1576542 RepID=A0A9P8W2V2_9HYPO|nr:hypothetical protein B0T10DRAFT_491130 [Thelonectria olida]